MVRLGDKLACVHVALEEIFEGTHTENFFRRVGAELGLQANFTVALQSMSRSFSADKTLMEAGVSAGDTVHLTVLEDGGMQGVFSGLDTIPAEADEALGSGEDLVIDVGALLGELTHNVSRTEGGMQQMNTLQTVQSETETLSAVEIPSGGESLGEHLFGDAPIIQTQIHDEGSRRVNVSGGCEEANQLELGPDAEIKDELAYRKGAQDNRILELHRNVSELEALLRVATENRGDARLVRWEQEGRRDICLSAEKVEGGNTQAKIIEAQTYLQAVVDRLNESKESKDTAGRKEVEDQVEVLDGVMKVMKARLSPAADLVFDSAMDDDETLLNLMSAACWTQNSGGTR
jgi:hypothetical protein